MSATQLQLAVLPAPIITPDSKATQRIVVEYVNGTGTVCRHDMPRGQMSVISIIIIITFINSIFSPLYFCPVNLL